jgi:fructokinase
MRRNFTVVGLGEVLWDLLPGGRKLGGAPTNFAYISTLLGDRGVVASRVGDDALGRDALERLKTLGVETSYVQLDHSHRTGTVKVQLDRQGQPRFVIREDVAWDFLSWSEGWKKLAHEADAVCFGTPAQRLPRSRRAIFQFLRNTKAVRVFDVNLRQDFYSAGVLRESVAMASIVKMNDDELPIVLKSLALKPGEDKAAAKQLLDLGPKLVCVTRGRYGSFLITRRGAVEHEGFSVPVKDTVGVGDAFTAALVHEYLREAPLEKMNDAGNRMGSWVATQAGGTPVIGTQELREALAELQRKIPTLTSQGTLT